MSIEKVKAHKIDGIDFYCSASGEETGMSQSGLFKFSGVPETSGRRLFKEYFQDNPLDRQNNFPKPLDRWNRESVYCSNLAADNNLIKENVERHILKSEFCAEFCAFIAYEYKQGNEIAKYSLKKFTSVGIKTFIQELTGYKKVEGSDMDQVLAMLTNLTKDVSAMKIELGKTAGYRTAKVFYPGLSFIPEEATEDDTLYLPAGDQSWYTISEALVELFPMMSFEKGAKISIGKMVAASWKTLKQEIPNKVVRTKITGQKMVAVAAYPASFLPVIKNDMVKFIITG